MNIITNLTSIEELTKYIVEFNKISKNEELKDKTNLTITIIHIIVGSKTMQMSEYTTHNHEYTTFLQTLFNNPIQQFSPELISHLHHYSYIKIKNKVILIDPMYSHYNTLEGFQELFQTNPRDNLSNETIIHHHNDTFTIIKTTIDIIQVACDIKEEQVIEIINTIDITDTKTNTNEPTILFNIMDCSSRELISLYASLTSYGKHHLQHKFQKTKHKSQIHITRPDCLIKDKEQLYNPIITIENKSHNQHQSHNTIRWINFQDDSHLIPELSVILDICPASKITHYFLTECYKHTIGFEVLSLIIKIWGRLSYTNIQEILIYHSNDDNDNDDKRITQTKLLINFSEILFIDFIKYWTQYNDFRTHFLMYSDSYYKYHIIYFLDYFINKYEDSANNGTITITEALQNEAIFMFRQFMDLSYHYNYTDYIVKNISLDNYKLLERKHIIDFLTLNNIYL
jgi:hypothetical protein